MALVKYGMRAWRDDHCVAFWLLYQSVAGGRRKIIRDLRSSSASDASPPPTAPIHSIPPFRNCDFDFYLETFEQKGGESWRFALSEEVASRHPAKCAPRLFGNR